MHLKTIRAKRQLAQTQDQPVDEVSTRKTALGWLHAKILEAQAGLDPYDPRTFIVELGPNETKWGTLAVCHCGWPLNRVERPDGSVRLYAVLEADVRAELGLDSPGAPVMADEPLASRSLEAVPDLAETTRDLVAPSIHAISAGEPVAVAAIRRAREAYDRQAIDRICPTCRGTGGGVYNDCPTCCGDGAVA
jgi:hypothetical protein